MVVRNSLSNILESLCDYWVKIDSEKLKMFEYFLSYLANFN